MHWQGWNLPYQWGSLALSDEIINESNAIYSSVSYGLNVYPNPVSDMMMVSDVTSGSQISLVNVAGQQVISAIAAGRQVRIDVSDIQPGLYILKIGADTQKVIIE